MGVDEDDEEEEPESSENEGMDHDELIFGNTTDLIIALSKSLGDGFLLYF